MIALAMVVCVASAILIDLCAHAGGWWPLGIVVLFPLGVAGIVACLNRAGLR